MPETGGARSPDNRAAPARTVVQSIESEFQRYRTLAEGALAQLSDDQLHHELAEGSLAVATVMRHLAGNFSSRFTDFLTSDGEKSWRDRDGEFVAAELPRDELEATWRLGWRVLEGAVAELDDGHLAHTITIRGQPLTVLQALQRSLAHASYHVGQMVYLAKAHRGRDWRSLSIPPGGSAEYNLNPTRERPPKAR